MVNHAALLKHDLNHVWHPCTQMKDLEQHPPLVIERAEGSYLYTDQGPIIDAISSWWCKALGHGHPAILRAMKDQLTRFEHVIGAGTTHPGIVELATTLASLSRLQHVFFASDGASAVEIAMKLALHAMQLRGEQERRDFVALKHGYHGETLGTLAVSDLGLYKAPYEGFGPRCHVLHAIPYVTGDRDVLWEACDQEWAMTKQHLESIKSSVCAILVEPIIQGAGGMRCYSARFLNQLATWAKTNGIYLIADEIMTGLGRTGAWFASQHAEVTPDLMCLSKGLTGGALPLSCVMIDHAIYDLFYHETKDSRSFLHSHTYSGNPLAVSAALATLQTMQTEHIPEQAVTLGRYMHQCFSEVAAQTGYLSNIRSIGAIVAGDLRPTNNDRLGFELQHQALQRGALLRPLGNTLYWLPPINTDKATIEKLAEITLHSMEAVYLD